MLTYVVYIISAFLVRAIWRAESAADAIGYVLVSALVPLPLIMLGNSADAGIFPIDFCLFAFLFVHGFSSCLRIRDLGALPSSIIILLGLCILASISGLFNFVFVDQAPWTFYGFTVIKFWEYLLLAMALMANRPNQKQLQQICLVLLVGIAVYEILHMLHLSGIVPMSGREYFGPRAANFGVDMDDDQMGSGAAAFSDRTAWFLTSYRVAIAGTASVGACLSCFIFELFEGKMKWIAGTTGVLCFLSVLGTSSRSDIAGILVAAAVFVLCSPLKRWKSYICLGLAVAGLYSILLTVFSSPEQRTEALERMSEFWDPALRSEGDYASRAHDRSVMLNYLPDHPRQFLIGVGPGNYHWLADQRITMNSFGHNSYLHWTGELGIGGLLLLVSWCASVCIYSLVRNSNRNPVNGIAARMALALVVSRIVAAWGAESLFGTQGLGNYSLFFVGALYFLLSVASNTRYRGDELTQRFSQANHSLHPQPVLKIRASSQKCPLVDARQNRL